ncbi:MAG: lysophospholipid acyltransferase family protein [Castellaniella sp.]|uniref:lysophospholipid acyltransferase family protein n=1 Tax=Castellaniella sp. TaxID=1955812 RepID=UPI002A35EB9C|nr:lysophospholipid acyltransferase family protein [Castellaniella sp.]MDY0309380.1 lysophospholipid acyltransferase family protein [Castellaniella sp.]
MALFLFLFRFVCVSAWVLLGLLTELVVFPILRRTQRRRIVGAWSRGLMWLCGVRVRCLGDPVIRGAVLWVANHVSWVDIFVLNSVRTTSFVAKSDIRRWPVIGLLVAWAGTLFIDRHHRHAVRDAGRQMRACFDQGDAVGLFPEGTTTDGADVRPFHAGLFDAAVRAGVPTQPVALRFLRRGRRAPELAFVGEQTLVANLWCLLGAWGVTVECEFLAPIRTADGLSRSDVARCAQAAIGAAVRAEPK